MTAAGTETCDGCDREGPAEQLEEVILPSGAMVVCPECRYHAEELAQNATADCEGCGDAVTAASLSRTELPDGTDLVLCSDCRDAVSAGERPAGASEADADTDATQHGEKADATGTAGSASHASAAAGDAAGSSSTGEGAAGGATTAGPSASQRTGESDGSGASPSADGSANAGDTVTDGATARPATTKNSCDQCGGLFSIELYQVITVDGRTEQFCPECKDDGLENGIVRDVELRRAQAYEVLGLEGSASSDDVRQAYLEQVKEVHPDRADGDRSEFMLVQQAYERLRDD